MIFITYLAILMLLHSRTQLVPLSSGHRICGYAIMTF